MQLSNSEEQLMNFLWDLGPSYMKDLIQQYADPKPAQTTIATLLKRIQDKGYIDYVREGRSRKYNALVSKEDYVAGRFQGFVKSFFGDSSAQFASFFAKSNTMSKNELQQLRDMIDNRLKEEKS